MALSGDAIADDAAYDDVLFDAARFYESRLVDEPASGATYAPISTTSPSSPPPSVMALDDTPVSRAALTLRRVVPLDERIRDVDGDTYTNAVARATLLAAAWRADATASRRADGSAARWRLLAHRIGVPYDARVGRHPEHVNYRWGRRLRRSGTVLLRYPLEHPLAPELVARDADYYEAQTAGDGLATAAAALAAVYAELGDRRAADRQLARAARAQHGPFFSWHTDADHGGCHHYLPAAGAFVQALAFGYGGVRVHADHLMLRPVRIGGDADALHLRGLRYHGHAIDVHVGRQGTHLLHAAAPVRSGRSGNNNGDRAGSNSGDQQQQLQQQQLYACWGSCEAAEAPRPIGVGDQLLVPSATIVYIAAHNASILVALPQRLRRELDEALRSAVLLMPRRPREPRPTAPAALTTSALLTGGIVFAIVFFHIWLLRLVYRECTNSGSSSNSNNNSSSHNYRGPFWRIPAASVSSSTLLRGRSGRS